MRTRALVVAGLMLVAAPAAAQQPVGEIVNVEGRGEHRPPRENAYRVAVPGQKLLPLARVRTLDLSRMVLKYADGTGQHVGPNSEIEVVEPPPSGANRIRIQRGKTWMQSNGPARPVEVESPSALAAIRGTDWEIVVDADGRMTLSVFSGEVVLSNALGSVSVGPNEQAEAQVGRAPVKLTLAVSRDRIQWVSSLTIDPARHPGEDLPAAYRRLRGLQEPGVQQAVLLADIELFRGEVPAARRVLEQAAARFAAEPALDVALARVALFAGDLDAAATHAQRALARQPHSADALVALGDVERRRGNAREALAAYGGAVALAAGDARGWHGLGVVESERENVRRARGYLERAIALAPREASHLAELGTLEGFAGNLAQARATLERAVAMRPEDYVALTGLGVVLLKAGETDAALDALIKATTIEPRYARAHVYAAVAYYQLEREGATRMLARATELDPNDPLPYLLRGIIHLDRLEPTDAARAARGALERIPYLKSLNQVADNQRGIGNAGFPLAFLGLEGWARSAAHESYLPSWGGSHLFLADRYPGEFNRRSELTQGFMANPLAFGASNRFQALVPRPGHFGTLSLRLGRSDDIQLVEPVIAANGLVASPRPFAYFVEAIDTRVDPRNADFELRGQTYTVALGARPTHELGLFMYLNHLKADAVLGRADVTGEVAQVRGDASRIDAGVHYAPDGRSGLWLKLGGSRQDAQVDTLGSILLPGQHLLREQRFETRPRERDIAARYVHTLHDRLELAVGAEAARAETPRRLERDAQFHFEGTAAARELLDQRDVDRSTGLQLSVRYLGDTWRVEGGVAPARYRVSRDIHIERPSGPTNLGEQFSRDTSGVFLGAVVKPQAAWLVRGACREWLRPASLDTMVPVAVAGVPLDDQLVFAGGEQQQCRAQVEWTPGASTFVSAYWERSRTRNLVSPLDGVLNTRSDVTNLDRLRNRVLTPPPKPDLLEDIPVYGEGEVRRGVVMVEQIVARGLAARLHYLHTDSRNTAAAFAGRSIPYLAREQVNLGLTWAPGWHAYVQLFAVHRGRRFADEDNRVALPSGWDLHANAFIETADKRWALELSAANLLKKQASDVFGAVVSYRF